MAPIPENVLRCSIHFNLGTQEEAVFGFHGIRLHTEGNTTDWPSDVTALAEEIRDDFVSKVDTASFGGGVVATGVNVYHLGTDNRALDRGMATFDGDNTWAGSASNTMPYEVTQFIRMYGYDHNALVPQRANKRGGYFLPPFGSSSVQGDEGVISSTVFEAVAGDQLAFINEVNGWDFPGTVSPFADDRFQIGILSVRRGYFTPLVQLGFGNVFDAQRRRRRSQIETVGYSDVTPVST